MKYGRMNILLMQRQIETLGEQILEKMYVPHIR